MKYKRKIIIAAVFAAVIIFMCSFLTACQNKPQELNLEGKKEIEVYCFGDSITWGMYRTKELEEKIANGEIITSTDDGGQLFEDLNMYVSSVYKCNPTYPMVLEKELNQKLQEAGKEITVKTIEDGICGDWITKDSYKRIVGNPDIVIILYSGNNFHFDQPYEGMLEANIKALQEKGCYIYLADYGLYPGAKITKYFEDANKYIKKVSKEMNIPLIDTNAYFKSEVEQGNYSIDDLFSIDHIHLSKKGYELLGKLAAEKIFEDIK